THDHRANANANRRAYADVRDVLIDERATAEVIDNDQQRETAQPSRAGFPLEPVQLAREFIRRLPFLDDIETSTVHHPNLGSFAGVGQRFLFFAEPRVEPG